MNYLSQDKKIGGPAGDAIVIGASVTAQAVTGTMSVTDGDSKHLSVAVKCSDVTSTTGISAILQDSHDGGITWATAGTIVIDANGVFEIIHNIDDGTDTPLWPHSRIVVTTGADDAVTVDAVFVTRRR